MKKFKSIWSRAAPVLRRGCRRGGQVLGTYLDDLLLIAGGGCLVRAALEQWGRPAAYAAAGVCLVVYALIVARSRRGGDRR